MNFAKTDQEVEKMRVAGRMLADIMDQLEGHVNVGVSTKELDTIAHELIRAQGAIPAFLGYGAEHGTPFPATICASLNEEIVHGIPSDDVILRDGDIFSIDIGLIYDGYVSDMARTFAIGAISSHAQQLIDVTKECFFRGIAQIHDGATLYDYADAVQHYVESHRFSVVRDLVGHGIGRQLHMPPQIPNYHDTRSNNFTFVKNMTVALEPMVTAGTWQIKIAPDQWTYVTADESLSAHYENTILVTADGVEILTKTADLN